MSHMPPAPPPLIPWRIYREVYCDNRKSQNIERWFFYLRLLPLDQQIEVIRRCVRSSNPQWRDFNRNTYYASWLREYADMIKDVA
jgi:cell division FtsZ-interacting protein ZapD